MPRRRSSSLLDDLFDLLEMIFRVVPPWICIPVAIIGFVLIVLLLPTLTGPLESLNFFRFIFGGIFAFLCLAAGLRAWLMGKRQRGFPDIQPANSPSCPICQHPMVLRRARRGQNAGRQFWGCSKYPSCRGVRDLS